MKKIFSILLALVLVVSLGLVTAAPVAAQITVLNHFKCYPVYEGTAPYVGEVVQLEDQFGDVEAEVGGAEFFCNPVEKWHDGVQMPILNWEHHLTLYSLSHEEEPQERIVKVENQFGTQQLVVSDPVLLGVPTWKLDPGEQDPPVGLDHFLLYEVTEGPSVDVVVGLDDQFGDQPEVLVKWPIGFGIPVQKTHDGVVTEIENPEAHLVFYEIEWGEFETNVQVVNQFGAQTLDMEGPYLFAVPSEKVYYEPMYPALPPVR